MNRSKKLGAFLGILLVVLLAASMALASGATSPSVPYMSKDSIVCAGVNGLQFADTPTYDPQTGRWNIVIDTQKTDWNAVVAEGYNTDGTIRALQMVWTNSAATQAGLFRFGGSLQYYKEDMASLPYISMRPLGSNDKSMRVSLPLGSYSAAAGKLFLTPVSEEEYRAFGVRWQESGSTDSQTAHCLYTISFSPNVQSVDVKMGAVAQEQITANVDGISGLAASYSNGKLQYASEDALSSAATLVTKVAAPASMPNATVTSYGSSAVRYENNNTVIYLSNDLSAGDTASEFVDVLVWTDASGKKLMQKLTQTVGIGEPKPWPEYVSDLVPFHKGQIRFEVTGNVPGTSADLARFDEYAIVHLDLEASALIQAAANGIELSTAELRTIITPPENAVAYREGPSGNTVSIYGSEIAQYSYPTPEQLNALKLIPLTGDQLVVTQSYLTRQQIQRADGEAMNYYFTSSRNLSGTYAGMVHQFFWYDAQNQLIGQNYVIFTYEDAPLITTTEVFSDEKEMDGHKHDKKPMAVIKGDWKDKHGRLHFKADRHPSSPFTHYYDLKLIDDAGNVVKPEGECEIYLPYPDGYNETNAEELEITIGHYDEKHNLISNDVYSFKKGNLKHTTYGMCFKVRDFSPYVVSWKDAEQPAATPTTPDLPKTGDSFPMATLLLIALTSLAGTWLLSRRKRA